MKGEKQSRKMRLMNRRRKLRAVGAAGDDKAEPKPPKRRYSTEVDKLVDGGQLLLPKIYRQERAAHIFLTMFCMNSAMVGIETGKF